MRAVVQRVTRARVEVAGETVGEIGSGLVILLGVARTDTEADADQVASRIAGLRVFSDADGRMNLSLAEIQGSALVVSQFTLYGDARKGRRPNYSRAAPAELGERLYLRFVEVLRAAAIPVETGRFGAMMAVHLVNDGPVTVLIDSERTF